MADAPVAASMAEPLPQAVDELLGSVLAVGLAVVPALDAASVSLAAPAGWYETAASTHESVVGIDQVQYRSGGPCVEAISTGHEVRQRLPVERWAQFSEAAEASGFAAAWSIPVMARTAPTGALNLYFKASDPWTQPASQVAATLASQASVVMANAVALSNVEQLNSTLRRALETRTVIGQAQGVLMARQHVTGDDAFDILRRASQRTNRKLRDIAAEIVAGVVTRESPGR